MKASQQQHTKDSKTVKELQSKLNNLESEEKKEHGQLTQVARTAD